MTSYARLRIEKYLEGERMTAGAVVDVRLVDSQGPGKRVARANVPIGGQGSVESKVYLDPGKYEFTVILPSGDVLSTVADIDARPDGVPIVFEMGHSAHEWLSWQHALGNVAGVEALSRKDLVNRLDGGWLSDVVARMFYGGKLADGRDGVAMAVAEHLARAPDRGREPIVLDPAMHDLPRVSDPPYTVFRAPVGGHIDYQDAQFRRSYALCADGANRQMLCALPHPWRNENQKEATVELMVGPDRPLDMEATNLWSVSTIARDDRVASVLSYFAAGDDSAAAFLAKTALDLLFGKVLNPLAASAGAYVLIDQWLRQRTAAAGWLDWIDNLANWFPWLPDGELLRGWVALVGKKDKPSIADARAAFVEAERRGIPIYTAGVKRLADGLTRIVNQDKKEGRDDPAVTGALNRIRKVAWNTDPRFPFTTIRLWSDAS